MPSASTRPSGPSGAATQLPATGGGAATDFLQNRPPSASQLPAGPGGANRPGERPSAGQLPSERPNAGDGSISDNRGDRVDNRDGNRTDRQDTRSDRRDDVSDNRSDRVDNRQDNRGDRQDTRQDNRSDRRDNLTDHRADRIDNMQQRKVDRQERRDQVRDQYRDNHPRAAFWKDHPYWARWRWSAPYRRTTWAALSSWGAWGSGSAANYSYGETIYYEEGDVYYGDSTVATEEEYALQAQAIAESAPAVTEAASAEVTDEDWLPLGVFALTADGEASGPPPSMFLQLAVSKKGVIAGTFHKNDTEQTEQVEGAVNTKNQRTAWGVAGKNWPIMETGLANLTADTGPALLHFADGQTQQWLLVRVEDPENPTGQ